MPSTITSGTEFHYRLGFRRVSDGVQIPGSRVSPAYLEPARAQTIFRGQRAGFIGDDSAEAQVVEEPLFAPGTEGQIAGVKIIAGNGVEQAESQFDLESVFEVPAQAELAQLVKLGVLGQDTKAVYNVFAEAEQQSGSAESNGGVVASIRRRPLPLVAGKLDDYLQLAEACGTIDERDHPLFIPEHLFQRARDYSFKTGRQEGGAMMLARLFQQKQPKPEIFAVVHAVIELRHGKQTMFGFEPTEQTFADLNEQMTLRQDRLGFTDEVAAVLVHNHPFEPSVREDGVSQCRTCPQRPTCQLTTSFYSAGDVAFHMGMFGSQPWICGMVIGLTARSEENVKLFCLDGSKSRERGFYRIKSIKSDAGE